MKERSHCSHFYTENKLIMTFLHRLSESFCMGDAISFTGKAAYKQGAQDLTVIMYWVKLISWSMLPWSIWMASPAIPTISLISQRSQPFSVGQGSAMWTGSSQPSARFILQMDFICLLQFPENHLQGKIHFSLQDSWFPWASASFIGKKMRWLLVNLKPNSFVRLLFHHTGGQTSTASNWKLSLSCDLYNIYSITEMHSRSAMIILISLERRHAFPCLRSSSLGTHLK